MKNQVQLCTYADRLGQGTLETINTLLQRDFAGLFGGIHLLPFYYPIDGADAGFDPIDHATVDQRLGTWSDVAKIAEHTEVMADMIVNHMSANSEQFKDFLQRGSDSPYADLFLTFARVFPQGATEEQLNTLYRPRPGLPFTKMKFADGQWRMMWTTFTGQQIDIDVSSEAGRGYLTQVLDALASGGVKMIRLDAAGYAVKKADTSCFMTPDTFDFIGELTREAKTRGMEILVEIHSHYLTQVAIAKQATWVYDFALPPLVLHALHNADAAPLREWYGISPRNCISVLDTHDGIGIIDVAPERGVGKGLLDDQQIDQLVETIHEASNGNSRKATGAAASNVDLYQVNCTFLDALGGDESRYLLARAIQFFSPGIPQVYYVGLLLGHNDMELLNRTGVGRDINRHYYSSDEIQAALAQPGVQHLMGLILLRNRHPAFQRGEFSCLTDVAEHELHLKWQGEDASSVSLSINLRSGKFSVVTIIDEHTDRFSCWDSLLGFAKQLPAL